MGSIPEPGSLHPGSQVKVKVRDGTDGIKLMYATVRSEPFSGEYETSSGRKIPCEFLVRVHVHLTPFADGLFINFMFFSVSVKYSLVCCIYFYILEIQVPITHLLIANVEDESSGSSNASPSNPTPSGRLQRCAVAFYTTFGRQLQMRNYVEGRLSISPPDVAQLSHHSNSSPMIAGTSRQAAGSDGQAAVSHGHTTPTPPVPDRAENVQDLSDASTTTPPPTPAQFANRQARVSPMIACSSQEARAALRQATGSPIRSPQLQRQESPQRHGFGWPRVPVYGVGTPQRFFHPNDTGNDFNGWGNYHLTLPLELPRQVDGTKRHEDSAPDAVVCIKFYVKDEIIGL